MYIKSHQTFFLNKLKQYKEMIKTIFFNMYICTTIQCLYIHLYTLFFL
jgi:hypothetical protein